MLPQNYVKLKTIRTKGYGSYRLFILTFSLIIVFLKKIEIKCEDVDQAASEGTHEGSKGRLG